MDENSQQDWEGRGRDRSAGLIDHAAAALLVIDCQERFRRCLAGQRLANVVRLIDVAHNVGIPVVLTQHCDIDAGSVLSRYWQDDIVKGSFDWQLLPEVPVAEADLRIQDKHTYDAFMRTGLEQELRARGVTTLIVTGAMTNLCCETTSRSAFTRDFDVVFVDDANGTLDAEMHEASVGNLRFFGCRIMTTDQVSVAIHG